MSAGTSHTVRASSARRGDVAPIISTLARTLLAAVFLVAGGLKVADPQSAVQAVQAYQLLTGSLVSLVGWGLPFFEIALGLLLLAGLLTRVSAAVSAGLLLVFIAAVVSAAARGLSIDCGCFGGGGRVAPGQTHYAAEVIRDLGLLALAAWLSWNPRSHLSLDHGQQQEEL